MGRPLWHHRLQRDPASGVGTVFSVPVGGGTITTLATFTGANGAFPESGLTLIGDTLYGTTVGGGGTVFSLPTSGGAPTTLVTFTGANGRGPYTGLTLGANGVLYGTTEFGGATDNGTAFSLTPTPEPTAWAALSLGTLGLTTLGIKARKRRPNPT